MSNQSIKHIAYGFFFIVLDVLFFQHLDVFGAKIDIILCYLIWLVQKYERKQLILSTGFVAFLQDAFFDLWGIMMFSKSLALFISYNFLKNKSDSQLQIWQIFIIILGVATLQNIILFCISSLFSVFASGLAPFTLIFGNSIYTALIGVLIYIFKVK